MKASKLIKQLQKLVEEHGDRDVIESYDAREVIRVEITDYKDESGTHDVIGLELAED